MVAHFGHKRHLLNLPAEGRALIKLAQYQTAGFGLARGWGPKVQYGSDRHMSGGRHSSWQICLVARWASKALATFVGNCDALGAWPE